MSVSLQRLAGILACLGWAMACPAQVSGPERPAGPSEAKAPARWIAAYGLESADDVKEFVAAGFNCALVELPIDFAADDTGKDAIKALLDACAEHNVSVMLGVHGVGVPPDPPSEINPYEYGYRRAFGDAAFQIVQIAKRHPAVAAWLTPSRASEYLRTRPEDLGDFLHTRYSDIGALREAWGSYLPTFADATRQEAARISGDTVLGFALPSLDVAEFDTVAYRDLIGLYARTYDTYDPDRRPVVVGEECAYWALADLPRGVGGAITGIYPDEADPDRVTQNAVAVDVARSGGIRRAFFGIRVTPDMRADELERLVSAGFVRGAWGIAVSDWHSVAGEKSLAQVIRRAAERSEALASYEPRPCAALLYQPIHSGAAAQTGEPLYGLLDLPGWPCEPMACLRVFSRGSRWGGIDVIPSHLASADVLSRYATVLAPQLYDVDEPLSAALWDYVRGGGVLYCDLGIGLRQTGSVQLLPETLVPLIGVMRITSLTHTEFDGVVYGGSPIFPSLVDSATTEGQPFSGLTGDARVTAGAKPTIVFRARREPRSRDPRVTYAGVFTNSVERGAVVFATNQIMAHWLPTEPLGAGFWGDLVSRGSLVENTTTPGLICPDIDVRSDGETVTAVNYSSAMLLATAGVPSASGRCFTGCVARTGAAVRGAELSCELAPGELMVATAVPLTVDAPAALVAVTSYGPKGLELQVAPFDARYTFGRIAGPELSGGTPQELALVLRPGTLRILPGERLDATLTRSDGTTSPLEAVAGPDGTVRIELGKTAAVGVTVKPRAPGKVGPA